MSAWKRKQALARALARSAEARQTPNIYSKHDPMRPVCKLCMRGHGSTYDGLCTDCRGCDAPTVRRLHQQGGNDHGKS